MDMRGKTTDFTFSHFLVVMLEEKDPEIIKWTGTMDSVIRCKDINIKALVTEVEGKICNFTEKLFVFKLKRKFEIELFIQYFLHETSLIKIF